MSTWSPASADSDWCRLPEVRWLLALVGLELFALVSYFGLSSATITDPRYVVYPFVWINVGVLAVLRTTPSKSNRRTRLVAVGISALYFLVLASLAGLIGFELGAHSHTHVQGFQFAMSAPGWGPRLGYAGSLVTLSFVPYRVIGYLALSYLVYATLLDAARAAVPGVIGVASCISCGLPIAGSLAAGAVGGMGSVVTATSLSVDISTAVFLGAVAVLVFRPGFES